MTSQHPKASESEKQASSPRTIYPAQNFPRRLDRWRGIHRAYHSSRPPVHPVIPALPLQSSLQASTKGKRSATLPTSKLPKQKYKKRAARPKTILNSPPAALALSSPSLPVSPAEPSQAPRKHNKSPALYTPEWVERREPKLYFGWDNEVFLDFQSGSGTRRLPISELGSRRVVLDADKLQVGEGHKR